MNFDELSTFSEEEKNIVRESIEQFFEDADKDAMDEIINQIAPICKILALDVETFEQVAPILEEHMYKAYFNYTTQSNLIQLARNGLIDIERDIDQYRKVLTSIYASIIAGGAASARKQLFIDKVLSYYKQALEQAIYNVDICEIPVELTSENGRIPQFANEGDAGADLYSTVEMDIRPGEQIMIPLDFKVEIPNGYAMLIQPRSGQSAKTKLRICNTPGLIDSGYRGVVGVLVENIDPPIRNVEYDFITENGNDDPYILLRSIEHGQNIHIDKGQRIAQARIVKVPKVTYVETEQVNETSRGEGGFGSTGSF